MFPFLFGFSIMHFIENIMKNAMNSKERSNSAGYNPVAKPSEVSADMHAIHKWIEGERLTTYKDSRGIPTVGIGLTKFKDGSKPVLGRTYSLDFLRENYYYRVSYEFVPVVKNFFSKANLLGGYDQNLFDVVFDLYFQGFHKERAERGILELRKGKSYFANWLLTHDGMLKHFWNPKMPGFYASRWGVLKRAYWRAHRVMGIKKTPQECEAWLRLYRMGKEKIPYFF
ncbi:hypothetical protein ACFFUE_10125 [Bergeyella porcorum]